MSTSFQSVGRLWLTIVTTSFLFGTLASSATDYQEVVLDSERALSLEPLWETDLSSIPDTKNDAYENEHGVFVIGNTAYVYVFPYSSKIPTLRRFNLTTGEYEGSIELLSTDDPLYNFGLHYVVKDDIDHICLVSAYLTNSYSSNNYEGYNLYLSVRCFENVDDPSEFVSSEYIIENNRYIFSERFWNNVEVPNIIGDATSNFDVVINGWHSRSDGSLSYEFHPKRCVFHFLNRQFSTLTGEYFEKGDLADGSIFPNNDTRPSSKYNYISVVDIDSTKKLIQGNLSTAPMIYEKSEGDETLAECPEFDYYVNKAALVDHTPEENPEGELEGHYGAELVTLGSETLLLTTERTYHTLGPKFKLSHWPGDHTSFDGLQSLWQFPQEGTFSRPEKLYDYARPRFAIFDTPSSTSVSRRETTQQNSRQVITYVPGSGLAAYRISLSGNNLTSSGIDTVVSDASSASNFRVETTDGHLTIKWTGSSHPSKATVTTIDGRIVLTISPESFSDGIATSALAKDLYLITINDVTQKFVVR